MAEHQVPAEKIALKLRRSEAAVRAEARKRHVMLAPPERQLKLASPERLSTPTDKRPYGGLRVQPRRSIAKASAPGRPARSRAERTSQNETLF